MHHHSTRASTTPTVCMESLERRALLAAPFALSGDPSVHPNDFRVTTFAQSLPYYPTGFLQLPDNSYLVAANDPGPTGYYSSPSLPHCNALSRRNLLLPFFLVCFLLRSSQSQGKWEMGKRHEHALTSGPSPDRGRGENAVRNLLPRSN